MARHELSKNRVGLINECLKPRSDLEDATRETTCTFLGLCAPFRELLKTMLPKSLACVPASPLSWKRGSSQ